MFGQSRGEFTLNEFRRDLQRMVRPSLLRRLLEMLPGSLAKDYRTAEFHRSVNHFLGAIDSMTPAERATPEIVDQSRRHRIAKGAGVPARHVKHLVQMFTAMKPVIENPGFENPSPRRTGKPPQSPRRPGDEPPDQEGGAVCS